ncbi:MAG: 30S ribosomal protein S12 methylthiotransferase RimO, partial [Gammaproteobacteria bacterium]|nr:30S ribosomal protein S12 methylthiotransferase RimO [Gammaproteobacteria bacterium]
IARTSSDAPDIDGVVYIEVPENRPDIHELKVGDITQVTITNSDEYDMQGKLVNN